MVGSNDDPSALNACLTTRGQLCVTTHFLRMRGAAYSLLMLMMQFDFT